MRNIALAVLLTFPLLTIATAMAQSFASPTNSVNNLVREVITNELKQSDVDRSRWTYDLIADEGGQQRTKRVVEMRDGSIERLVAVNGQALTIDKQQEEKRRIEQFVSNPDEQKKLKQVQAKDAAQCATFLKMMPEALAFSDGGQEGDLRRLTFKPNPTFQPPSWQARVLHAMAGELFIHTEDRRLAMINGHLVEDVKFGGGLLGHLKAGGHFHVERTNIGSGHWEMTLLDVQMNGKALLFRTIAVQHKEVRTNFYRVGDNLTAHDAAETLNNHIVLASVRR
jgi:hypothetical protein